MSVTKSSEFHIKQMICDVGKLMYQKNFVAANDGNISVKVSENRILCTPTGVSKGLMTPNMIVTLDKNGKHIAGEYKESSEIKMHLRVYKENSEVQAVVHAHPIAATSYAIAGIELNLALNSESVVLLGRVPIAPYATPGSEGVPDSIAPYCTKQNAVLLANHGALTWGKDLMEAYYRMESLEHYANMYLYTTRLIGAYNTLECKDVSTLLELREKMGIKTGGVPECSCSVGKDTKEMLINDISKSVLHRIKRGE